jgi:hypothetical protein
LIRRFATVLVARRLVALPTLIFAVRFFGRSDPSILSKIERPLLADSSPHDSIDERLLLMEADVQNREIHKTQMSGW